MSGCFALSELNVNPLRKFDLRRLDDHRAFPEFAGDKHLICSSDHLIGERCAQHLEPLEGHHKLSVGWKGPKGGEETLAGVLPLKTCSEACSELSNRESLHRHGLH